MQIAFLHDLPLPSPFAAPIQILQTARALAEAGHHVRTGWLDVTDRRDALAHYGVLDHPDLSVEAWPASAGRRATFGRAASDWIGDADAVIGRGECGVKMFDHLRRQGRRPAFVFEAHRPVAATGRLAKLRQWRLEKLERQAVREADGLLFITPGIRDDLLAQHNAGNTRPTLVLPSGVTLPDDAESGVERDLDVIFAGKLMRRKGSDHIADVARALPQVRFTIIGDGDVGGPTNLTAAGYVPPGELDAYLRRAKVGLCPLPGNVSAISERYTSPMKILAMMAFGVAVVASDLPSVRQILTHDRNALLVPADDVDATARAVQRLLSDGDLRERLTAQARLDVAPYAWPERARRLASFLEGVVATRSP